MKRWPFEQMISGRAFLCGGLMFVIIGGAAAIVIERERGLLHQRDSLPSILAGQVTTHLPGVRVDRLGVVLRQENGSPLGYTQSIETDETGCFGFKGPLEGVVRVSLGVNDKKCKGDITNLTILLEPGEKPARESQKAATNFARLRPARRDEARQRPLVGVLPESVHAP